MEELRGVEEKWRVIGGAFPTHVRVNDITYPDPTDCLREVVRRRLSGFITTWGHIIVVVREANEPQLADNLKAKYIPGELTTTPSSQYSLESEHGENEMMFISWAVVYCNTELHVYNVLVSVEDTNTTNNYSPQNDLK